MPEDLALKMYLVQNSQINVRKKSIMQKVREIVYDFLPSSLLTNCK